MKRRTQGKEAEINAKLPFAKELVRKGHTAQRQGDSGLALACYAAAYEQLPLLFSIGLKAARIARSKYRLHFAQQLADMVSSNAFLSDYWGHKAQIISIECLIRRMMPWLDCGLAPKLLFSFAGEGGYANLFELVRNPHLPPRRDLSVKTQQVFDRLGRDLHIYFKLNTSSIFGEAELDFPVCWMTNYVNDIHEALDNMRHYLKPDHHFHGLFNPTMVGSDYTAEVASYMQKTFGKKLSECHFKISKTEPVWDWPTSYLTIYAETPDPWMTEHNAMLKVIEASYPQDKVLEKQLAHQAFMESLKR